MFSFLKRNTLITALNKCQQHTKGTAQALTPRQYEFVIITELFKKVERLYKSQGLSNWGALSWFLAQFIEHILDSMKDKENFNIYKEFEDLDGSIYELVNKLSAMSFIIYDNIPGLKLTKIDMEPIEKAAIAANTWVNETETEEDKQLLGLCNGKKEQSINTAVNQKPEDASQTKSTSNQKDKMSVVCEVLVQSLSTQKQLVSGPSDKLNESATDNWSLGYVYGHSDSIMQNYGYDINENISVLVMIFEVIFGKTHGSEYLLRLSALQKERNSQVFEGMKVGGSELLAWLKDENNIPMGWTEHVHGVS